jgi:hypothetical protein
VTAGDTAHSRACRRKSARLPTGARHLQSFGARCRERSVTDVQWPVGGARQCTACAHTRSCEHTESHRIITLTLQPSLQLKAHSGDRSIISTACSKSGGAPMKRLPQRLESGPHVQHLAAMLGLTSGAGAKFQQRRHRDNFPAWPHSLPDPPWRGQPWTGVVGPPEEQGKEPMTQARGRRAL